MLGIASANGRVEMVKKLLKMRFSQFETDYVWIRGILMCSCINIFDLVWAHLTSLGGDI